VSSRFAWLIALLCSALTLPDSAALELAIEGEGGIDRGRLRASADAIPQGAPADTVAARLLQVLLAQGHGAAEVRVFGPDSSRRAELRPGPAWRLGRVRFVGSDLFRADDLAARLGARAGERFDAAALARDLTRLLDEWGRRGHLFARFSLRPRVTPQQRVDLTVVVDEGPQVRLGELRTAGNEVTAQTTLERAAGLRPGRVIDLQLFHQSGERLRRLGYFREVRGPVLTRASRPDLLDAELTVIEAPTHSAEGLLGYAPAAAGSGAQLTGYLELALHNLFGSGRELDLRWERIRSEELALHLQWRERWLFGSDASLLAGFEQVVQDSTFLEDALAIEIGYPLGGRFEGSLRFERRRVIPGRRRDGLVPQRSHTRSAGIALLRDSRDDRWNPRRGLLLEGDADLGRRASGTLLRAQARAELSLPAGRRRSWLAGLRLLALELPPGPVQLPDLYRLGGSGSLRGQREDALRVMRGALTSLELRFHTGPGSRVALFTDAAYLRRAEAATQGTRFAWRPLIGYGAGLRIASRAGLVGIDYGIDGGNSPSAGKIHLGIQNRF